MNRLFPKLLLFLFPLIFSVAIAAFSQTPPFPLDEWAKKLNSGNDNENKGYREIDNELANKDSLFVYSALHELEKRATSSTHYLNARLLCLRVTAQYRFNSTDSKSAIKQLSQQALTEAYSTGDAHLISFVSGHYGRYMFVYQEIELAATYLLKAEEINESLGEKSKDSYDRWLFLGEVFFHAREYEKSISYTLKGLEDWNDTSALADSHRTRYFNTIGQDYQQLGKLDSAMVNYERSLRLANKLNNDIWKGINSGFMGQVFFLRKEYEKAKPLLERDYSINKTYDYNIAAYSLQWLARINLIQGRKDTALLQLKEALNFLQKSRSFPLQNRNYLQHVYYATADVYRAIGNMDSFYHYFQLYSSLHDSLERVATLSSIKMAQVRIDNEKNYQTIQILLRERKAELLKRNFIIAAIILLSIIAFLYVNRLRLIHLHKEQLAVEQKKVAEAEIEAAKQQLQLFTQNIIEKSNLIEKLEQQVQHKQLSAEQHQIINELSHQTILTEDDWDKFKNLFEIIYPGFFVTLREKASDITISEQRMAALTRLKLTTKQMASMLGISIDSVHKTRQRLRQRLNLATEVNLEESVAGL